MTKKERSRLFDEYEAAVTRGDLEAAREIGKRIPLHPALAEFVREHYTPEQIREAFTMPSSED